LHFIATLTRSSWVVGQTTIYARERIVNLTPGLLTLSAQAIAMEQALL
jgi:hypothetical protein